MNNANEIQINKKMPGFSSFIFLQKNLYNNFIITIFFLHFQLSKLNKNKLVREIYK